jgi:phosphatidylinositol-3-phosphatase
MAVSRPMVGVALAIVLGLSLTACGDGSRASNNARAPAAAGLERVPAFGHLFVIVGENTSASEVTAARMPYISSAIRPRAAWLTNYFALTDGSLGNYAAMVSGQFVRCEANNDFSFANGDIPSQHACHQNVPTLFRQLDQAGISWQEWNESAANPCDIFDHGGTWARNSYAAHHNPALYFDDVQKHHSSEDLTPSPECIAKDLPMGTTAANDTSAWDRALAAGNVARFNLIIPNNCESGHDPCGGRPPRQFDDFLRREIPKIEASPAFGADGTIVITWDEGDDAPFSPRHLVLAAIGPRVKPGTYGAHFTHYSLLRTIEDGFGLRRHLAHAARAKAFSQIWK